MRTLQWRSTSPTWQCTSTCVDSLESPCQLPLGTGHRLAFSHPTALGRVAPASPQQSKGSSPHHDLEQPSKRPTVTALCVGMHTRSLQLLNYTMPLETTVKRARPASAEIRPARSESASWAPRAPGHLSRAISPPGLRARPLMGIPTWCQCYMPVYPSPLLRTCHGLPDHLRMVR